MTPRILFYVQHLLGIGHLARASRLADGLAEAGFDVTVVSGGSPVAGFPGPKVRHVLLPAILSGDAGFSALVDAQGNPIDDAFRAHRRDLLLAAFAQARPDIVMIEAFPFGRRQVRFELLPLLDRIAGMERRPKLVASIRDILQARAKPGRDEEAAALVQAHFDRVLVHGDPGFARLEDTFPLATRIADKVAYTGLVAPQRPPPPEERFDVVVSAGGGAVGAALIRAAVEAARVLPESLRWCLVTGPNLPQAAFDEIARIAPPGARVERFRPDFASLLAAAQLSVSQAGYNTVCDVLVAGCRSLLVPFTTGGETEQAVRAERLSAMGLADWMPETGLTGTGMAARIARALARPVPPQHALAIDGARRTPEILRSLLDSASG